MQPVLVAGRCASPILTPILHVAGAIGFEPACAQPRAPYKLTWAHAPLCCVTHRARWSALSISAQERPHEGKDKITEPLREAKVSELQHCFFFLLTIHLASVLLILERSNSFSGRGGHGGASGGRQKAADCGAVCPGVDSACADEPLSHFGHEFAVRRTAQGRWTGDGV